VIIVVKANAYGHGLAEVAKHLSSLADYIGVVVLEEGIFLRELGVTAPILVLGGIWGDQIPQYILHDLTLTASSAERLEQIDVVAGQMGVKAKVHLKIDTGMERIGVHYYSAHTIQETALKCSNIDVEGIISHFANADSHELAHARLQLERFNQVLRFYEDRSLPMPIRHIANSAAILQLQEIHFDMVRTGIMLYGVYLSSKWRAAFRSDLLSPGSHAWSISKLSRRGIRSVMVQPGNLTNRYALLPSRSGMGMGISQPVE